MIYRSAFSFLSKGKPYLLDLNRLRRMLKWKSRIGIRAAHCDATTRCRNSSQKTDMIARRVYIKRVWGLPKHTATKQKSVRLSPYQISPARPFYAQKRLHCSPNQLEPARSTHQIPVGPNS